MFKIQNIRAMLLSSKRALPTSMILPGNEKLPCSSKEIKIKENNGIFHTPYNMCNVSNYHTEMKLLTLMYINIQCLYNKCINVQSHWIYTLWT